MRRPVIFIALAGLAAMIASVIVYSALKRRDAEVAQAKAQTIYIVVAAGDLPLGTKLEPSQVKLARWSSDAMPEGAFTNPSQIAGAFVKSQFVANEPITASKLFLGQKTAGVMPLLIPPGMRAVSVPVDEVSDIAGFVLPHTHVDVLVAVQGSAGADKPFSKIVLQNVEVLAVAQEVEKRKDEPELVKVVTLLVNPQEAERLALATREGVLRLAMRNYTDSKIVLTSGTDVAQMLRAYSSAPAPVMTAQVTHTAAPAHPVKKFQVEIFRNGKTSESVSFVQALAEPMNHHDEASKAKSASASPAVKKAVQVASDDADDEADDDNGRAPSRPSTAAVAPAHPAAASSASLAPNPKTIDIP